jgi:hypothetical protein
MARWPGLGWEASHLQPPPFVPAPDQRRVGLESLRRGQRHRIEALPQTGQRIPKGGDAGLGGHPRAGEDDDALRPPQRGERVGVEAQRVKVQRIGPGHFSWNCTEGRMPLPGEVVALAPSAGAVGAPSTTERVIRMRSGGSLADR